MNFFFFFQKKVVEDKYFVLCENQLEDTWHVFFNCGYALQCWDKAGLPDKLESVIARSKILVDVFFEMLSDTGRNKATIFEMVTWQIWNDRNSMVLDNTCKSPSEAVSAWATARMASDEIVCHD